MKKGFTLAEVLGVVAIIAIIALLVTPQLINLVRNNKTRIANTEKKTLEVSAEKYVRDHQSTYQLTEPSRVYTITLFTLYHDGYVDEIFYNNNSLVALDENCSSPDKIKVVITVVDNKKSVSSQMQCED